MNNPSRLIRRFAPPAAFLIAFFLLPGPAPAGQQELELDGGGLSSTWDPVRGIMTRLSYRSPGDSGAEEYVFFDPGLGSAGFEVFDELERVRYSDRSTPGVTGNFRVSRLGTLKKVQFDKRFEGAPFVIHVTLTADASGLHLEYETTLLQLADGRWPAQRNLRVSFVMPAREELIGWAAAYPDPTPIKEKPIRYCYGIQEPGLPRTGIPLYTAYVPERAGVSIAMPLELPKVQLNMGPEPEDPAPLYVDIELGRPNAGASLGYRTQPPPLVPEQIKVIRFTELFVGLIADRPLRFAVRLFGHQPHWRPALGRMVEAYPEYFRMNPRMRSIYGSRLGSNVKVGPGELALFKRFGATATWLHTHFHRHGEFIPPEAVLDEDFTFFCEPYARDYPDNSVRKNRKVIDALTDNGQAVFLYGFNMHCDTITVFQRGLFADVARMADGSRTRCYHDQPVMYFNPRSPFGSHQLRQMDLMIKLYPRIMGIALDNWAYGGIDFAHDDGITMFGHRTGANVNFSQQRMIPAIAEKLHSRGRLVMINKARTIESMKGADSMLSEARGSEIFAMFAYMCLDRHLHPNEYRGSEDAEYAEYALKYCLEWGGQLGRGMVSADPGMSESYYRLIRGLRNRTWVLDPDPLGLPEGTRGNIFRIHPDSPWNPGDIVVTVVRPQVRLADGNFAEGLQVAVRLPEADKIARATWLGAEHSDRPAAACRMTRSGDELLVDLPPVGSAGLLRLELN